jgi:hypothetical protein
MGKACDFCVVLNQYVCEGHCGACEAADAEEKKAAEESKQIDGST